MLTAHELEAIRSVIANEQSRAFSVQIDPCGSWAHLTERYKRAEPPHVFHFAGHGLPGEKGLVFRGADGNALEVPVDRLVALLASRPGQRKTQLVFLNACYSAGTDSAVHPLGGIVRALHRQGIWAVLGVQSRVADRDAQTLAEGFYEQLAKGESIRRGSAGCAARSASEAEFGLGIRGAVPARDPWATSGQDDRLRQPG